MKPPTKPNANIKHGLIYRLRNRGYRIDTRTRTILVTEGFNPSDPSLIRLKKDFGFVIQKEMQPGLHARVYISGPIAHYDIEERRATFRRAEQRLRTQGYLPVNPFNNGVPTMENDENWREHMRADIRLLLGCSYIYFLPEWELSKGCKLELDVATSCGIKVLHFPQPANELF